MLTHIVITRKRTTNNKQQTNKNTTQEHQNLSVKQTKKRNMKICNSE